jgi:microcin C transport system permease protein
MWPWLWSILRFALIDDFMNFPRKIAILLLLIVIGSGVGRFYELELPSLRWFFSFALSESWAKRWPDLAPKFADAVGIFWLSLLSIVAVWLWLRGQSFAWNPMTLRRLKRFRSLTRGYVSFWLLLALVLLTLPDHLLVGRKALVVRYEDQWHFPALVKKNYTAEDFGGEAKQPLNYRDLRDHFERENDGNFVLMPLVPWDTTFDTDELQKVALEWRDGICYEAGKSQPYQGLATSYDPLDPTIKQREATFRRGQLQGLATLYNRQGDPIAKEQWQAGQLLSREVSEGSDTEIDPRQSKDYFALQYPPSPPSMSRAHWLGTDSRGWDLFAQIYGGLQVVCKASLLYVVLTFAIGISLGLVSGYFGGWLDLIMQRLIEVMSNIPFLFIVMIIASRIGRDQVSIVAIIAVMSAFSWIGVSIYQRTAALKERERDYVAAARVLGASTPRIIFRHILPNVLSTTITLIPFYVTGVATSLTALDFIGFGLPDRYPSWGTLLADGLANLEAPWIVGSVFVVLVALLLLITFIGEAIREAFDPKKFTTYH